MSRKLVLPDRVFRNDVVYRSVEPDAGAFHSSGCGFLLKPVAQQGYRDRQMLCFVAVIVLRGSGTMVDGRGRSHRVAAGAMLQHQPNRSHSVCPDADGQWAEFFFSLPGRLYEAVPSIFADDARMPVLWPGVDAAWCQRFETLLEHTRHAGERQMHRVVADGYRLLVDLRLAARDRLLGDQQTSMIDDACRLLAQVDPVGPEAVEVAARFHLSYERFRKLFREQVGMPPGEFRIRQRIARAQQLIAQKQHSVKAIAYRLGYADAFTFSKQFKRYTGMTPTTFAQSV